MPKYKFDDVRRLAEKRGFILEKERKNGCNYVLCDNSQGIEAVCVNLEEVVATIEDNYE